MATPSWAPEPTEDDVRKAARFLTLLDVTGPLHVDPEQRFYPAKDLLRAAWLPVLDKDNAGVRKWTGRLRDTFPPVLVMPGSFAIDRPSTIAEGYHRVCACYLRDERTPVAVHFLTV